MAIILKKVHTINLRIDGEDSVSSLAEGASEAPMWNRVSSPFGCDVIDGHGEVIMVALLYPKACGECF